MQQPHFFPETSLTPAQGGTMTWDEQALPLDGPTGDGQANERRGTEVLRPAPSQTLRTQNNLRNPEDPRNDQRQEKA